MEGRWRLDPDGDVLRNIELHFAYSIGIAAAGAGDDHHRAATVDLHPDVVDGPYLATAPAEQVALVLGVTMLGRGGHGRASGEIGVGASLAQSPCQRPHHQAEQRDQQQQGGDWHEHGCASAIVDADRDVPDGVELLGEVGVVVLGVGLAGPAVDAARSRDT